MQRGQAEALFPLIEEVLEAAGWRWDMLDAIGVGVGPGNFTGIRISVAAARGLRLSLRIPVFGFSTFTVAATDETGPDRLLLSLPAPRDMAYVQVFDGLVAREDPCLIDPSAPPRDLGADRVVGFRGAEIGAALGIPGADEVFPPKPAVLAELTEEAYLTADADPPRPAPLYIRPPDAAPSRVVPPVILP
jgi:tRNA threonylcarbamoyl adenosine modification protein YeaZ